MVAVVSGNGLGLFNTSLTGLGGLQGGPAGLGGRAGAQVVNITNGNLILQDQDENLTVRGFDAAVLRTYNSRGALAGIGQDGFVTGYERRVALTTGTLNVAASQMTLTTGDGQTQVFTYSSANTYTSTAGDGAHDTLVWNSGTSTWTMTEGSSLREEQYANHANTGLLGRLTRIRDLKSHSATPAQFDVIYSDNTASARITEIRSIDDRAMVALRDAILFTYNGLGQLSSITTRENGEAKSQVSYGYENTDGSGRLIWVQQDLTPSNLADGAWDAATPVNNNSLRFRTNYTYVTTTASDLRIASVTQSDGATVAYTYEADGGGGFRVKTVTQGSASDGSAQTVTFTYNANSTDVTDSLGRIWTYQYDANKQLTAILAPAIGGQRDTTTYTYDTSGNVTQVKTVSGAITLSQTDQSFDANGNVLWQWTRVDGATAPAIAIERTYSTSNQLLTETRFTGLDTDGPVATQSPSGGLTTNFIYDLQNRLRFSVDATGAVTERTYASTGNGIGQIASSRVYFGAAYSGLYDLTSVNNWATATQKVSSQLTEFTYDVKGRLQQSVSFASVNPSTGVGVTTDVANDITSYAYDAQGLLLQKIVVRGAARTTTYTATPPSTSEVSTYVYDGMGRLLSVLKRDFASALTDALTVSTTYAYTDSARQIVVTLDSGATRTETRNLAGQTTTMALAGSGQTTRTTQNFFDGAGQLRGSQDASGARRYFFYDDKGRLEAEVDATGAVTKYNYDGADRRLSTVQYANRVTTTTWLTGSTVNKALFADIGVVTDSANDRTSVNTFDAAGRVLTTTDGDAANANRQITTYTYDGAGRVTLIRTTDSVGTAANARETRQFYDNAGRLLATLDAERYLVRTTYDAAGRIIQTTRSAGKIVAPATIDATTLLSTLTIPLDAVNDQTTRYFYNGRGQQIGTLDAQGYLTEAIVDEAGNTRAERRYAKQLTGLTGTEIFSALKTLATTAAPTEAYRESKSAYNGLGQLITQTNYEGSVTRFTHDEAGRLVRTQAAQATTEVREGFRRYNVFDELIGEITGQQVDEAYVSLGNRLLTDPSLLPAELDTAYAKYGVTHNYDAMSRRIESIDARGIDTQGNKTWYFYDSQGRQTFTVKGVAQDNTGLTGLKNSFGEVTETRYSAFGQVTDSLAYTGRIAIASPYDRASVQSAINVLSFVAATDTRRQFMYDQRGLLKQSIDALSVSSNYNYTAFGQLNQELRATATSAAVTIQHNYDKRGLETSRTDASGNSLARTSSQSYDAFGRVITNTDARGAITTMTYDRLGRQITRSLNVTSEGVSRSETTTLAYDSYSQTVSITDALNNTTNYVYSDVNSSLRVTSQEGVAVTTTHNRYGQIATVSQVLPDGTTATTTYTYDKNGNRLTVSNPLGQSNSYAFDVRGLLYESTDASGRKVRYTYDAVGRVLTRSEDPTGLNLITTTSFDGQGRQVKVTDASGRITTMSYDQEGRLLQTAQDPSGLNLRTSYTYDAAGRQVTVTEGFGTASVRTTQYVYDVLGRRTQERIDPTGLNLTTNYLYDANDNVVQHTDATGNVSRFVYDEANRRIYDIDATGGVSKTTYDKNGQVIAVRSYTTAIVVSDLSTTAGATAATIKAKVDLVANEAIDQISYRVYDRDNRVRFSVTNLSSTTASISEQRYDSAGRASQSLAYAAAFTDAAALAKIKAGAAVLTDFTSYVTANEAAAQRQSSVYDAADRLRFSVDALGNVTEQRYDAAGRVVQSLAYAAALTDNALLTKIKLGTATLAEFATFITANDASAQRQSSVYDAAGRLRFSVDALGNVTEQRYDAAGRVVQSLAYAVVLSDDPLLSKIKLGTATLVEFNTFVINNEATAQRHSQVYDAAGRLRYTLNALGGLTETTYDAAGRVTETLIYTSNITLSAALKTKLQTGDATALADINALLLTRTTLAFDSGFDGNSLSGFDSSAGIAPTMSNGRVVFDRNPAVGGSYAFPVIVSGGRYTLSQGLTFAAEFSTQSDLTNTSMELGFNNEIAWLQPGYRREGISVQNGKLYRRQINGSDNQNFEVMTLSANTTYVVEIETQDGLVTTYVYAKGSDRSQGINFSANSSSASFGSSYWYAAGLHLPGVSGGSITLDNVSAATRKNAQVQAYRYDAAGRLIRTLDALGNVTEYGYDAASRRISTTDARGFSSYVVYDNAGRAKYSIDALGVVSEAIYDASGRVIAQRTYAAAIAINATLLGKLGSGTAIAGDIAALLTIDNIRDRQNYVVYDSAGRQRFSVDAAGNVTEKRYNALGRVTEALRYTQTISLSASLKSKLQTGDATALTDISGLLSTRTNLVWDSGFDTNAFTGFNTLGMNLPAFVNGEAEFNRNPTVTASSAQAIISNTNPYLVDGITYSSEIRIGTTLTGTLLMMGIQNEAPYLSSGFLRDAIMLEGGVLYRHQYSGSVETKTVLMNLSLDTVYIVETETANDHITTFVYAKGSDRASGASYTRTTTSATYGRTMWYAYSEHHPGVSGGSVFLDNVSATTRQNAQVQANRYDAAGRLVRSLDALGNATEYGYDAAGRRISVTDARGFTSYVVYDSAGRVKYGIDALGAVSESVFDATGQVIAQRAYVSAITINSSLLAKLNNGTAVVSDISSLISIDNARDRQSYAVYDNAGRECFSVDASGNVTETRYDAAGQIVETLAYLVPLPSTELNAVSAGTATLSTFTSFATTNANNARANAMAYDAAGHMVYALTRSDTTSQLAVVSERRYNAIGQVVAEVSYGITIAYSAGSSAASTNAAITNANGNLAANQRLTRYAYDADNRLRFTVNNGGEVSEQRYNALGQVTQSFQYGQTIAVTQVTEANIAAAIAGQTGMHSTTNAYDISGRLISTTDALNGTESYTYNATGQVLTRTNKLGNIWTYSYDAQGRQIEERSPSVNVARYDASGNVIIEAKPVVTRTAYDAVGNVVSRTENAEAVDALERRTTQYQYDARGRQIKTIFPDAYIINASGVLVATNTRPEIQITYNTLDQAVVQKDVRGNYNYKVYDVLGRAAYDVDAEGYVTAYSYNAYGEQTGLTRFASKLVTTGTAFTSASWVPGKAISSTQIQGGVTPNAADRTLVTTYDARGLKTQVQQGVVAYYNNGGLVLGTAAAPTTQYQYNAFAQVVKESVRLDATAWAHTYHYYDQLGRETTSVDAEGYVTTRTYDAFDQLSSVTEHARAISLAGITTASAPSVPAAGDEATGYNRTVTYTYDKLGRKVSETTLRQYETSAGGAVERNIVSAYTYDAIDQVLVTTIDGNDTTMTYDALGRATTVKEATRDVVKNTAESLLLGSNVTDLASSSLYESVSPYMTTVYDAFGAAIQVRRYANGWKAGSAIVDDNKDQIVSYLMDRQGRVVIETTALGTAATDVRKAFKAYDAADNLTSIWYARAGSDVSRNVTVRTDAAYDAVGRQISSVTKRTYADTSFVVDGREAVAYNAFGEIITKAATSADFGVTNKFTSYVYDLAGRLIQSNDAKGIVKSYGYNLAGMQIRESHLVHLNGATTATSSATTQTVDALGRMTKIVLPGYDQNNATATVTQRFDRWGNVIEVIDGRGFATQYVYNDRNQVIREIKPQSLVVSDTGIETWIRPVTEYYYDAAGQLVGTRDANGHLRKNVYDAAGRLMQTIDALGQTSRRAYDALGQAKFEQDALGYITYNEFDRGSRILSHGDYLADSAGTARLKTALETYVLDVDGNRIRVSDALLNMQKYDYDSRSLLVRSQTAMGVVKSYEYDATGNKTREADATNYQTWAYAYDGHLTGHRDLGGVNNSYTYADSGELSLETSDRTLSTNVSLWWQQDPELWDDLGFSTTNLTQIGYNRTTLYYANGQIKEIRDATNSLTYRYEYDAAGNRTMEESDTVDGQGKRIYVRTKITYDSQNRISQVTVDDLLAGTRMLDVRYKFDAVGNRRQVTAQSGFRVEGSTTVNSATPISVSNRAPVAVTAIPNRNVKSDITSSFVMSLADYFTDPEQASLAYTITKSDGSVLPSWLTASVDLAARTVTFTSTIPGAALQNQSFGIKIAASDGVASVSSTFNVTVVSNTGPVVSSASTPTLQLRQTQAFNLSLDAADYFQDADVGDRLTLSVVSVSPSPAWLTTTTSASTPDRIWLSGTPTSLTTISVTIRATDANGASVTKVINLLVSNPVAPVAQTPPARNIAIGQGFLFDHAISDLFTDANGDQMQLSAKLQSGAELPSWMRFQFEPGAQPPRIRFVGQVPPTATIGQNYSIVITARDTDGSTASTTLQLATVATTNTVYPYFSSLSVAIPIPNQTAAAGQAWSYVVPAGTFADSNNGTLAYEVESDWMAAMFLTGSIYRMPDWMSFDAATRTFSGTPTAPGDFSVTVAARDSFGEYVSTTFIVTTSAMAVAQPPTVLKPISDSTVMVGGTMYNFFTFTNTFADKNGGTLTYMARLQGGAALPAWATFDATNQYIVYNPPAGTATGILTIEVVATDSTGLSAVASFQLNVVATQPTAINKQEAWYAYDAMDRVIIVNGSLINGQILVGVTQQYGGIWGKFDSYGISYDAMGRAVSTIRGMQQSNTNSTVRIEQSAYNLRGQLQMVYHERPMNLTEASTLWTGSAVKLLRSYDAAGRLVESRQYFGYNEHINYAYTDDAAGWLKGGETYTYDTDGRITQQKVYGRIKGWTMPGSTLLLQSGAGVAALSATPLTLLSTTNTNYDTLGRTGSYNYTQNNWGMDDSLQTNPAGFTHTFTSTYEARDSYLEKSVSGSSTNTLYRASSTTSIYDSYGRRVEVKEETTLKDYKQTLTNLRYFSYDAEGGILSRRDGELKDGKFDQGRDVTGLYNTIVRNYDQAGNKNKHYAYARGQQVASFDEQGSVDAISGLTAYDQGSGGTSAALVQSGDTFQTIAQRVYGNSSMWYILAAANGMANDNELVSGTTLKVPSVQVSKNDAATFKPYNPAEIIGPTSPTLPYFADAPKQSCNMFAMIIMMVVVIVATIFTAGALAAPAATGFSAIMGAGVTALTTGALTVAGAGIAFASAVIGNIAGQVVGMALGVVDKLSLKDALISGVTAVATLGISKFVAGPLSKVIGTSKIAAAAANGALNNISSYAVSKAFGKDVHFSWASVAASAVTAGVSAAVTPKLSSALGFDMSKTSGQFGSDLVGGLVSGVVGNRVRNAFGFKETFNFGQIASDAFGNTLGNYLSGKHEYWASLIAADYAKAEEARVAREAKIANGPDYVTTGPEHGDFGSYRFSTDFSTGTNVAAGGTSAINPQGTAAQEPAAWFQTLSGRVIDLNRTQINKPISGYNMVNGARSGAEATVFPAVQVTGNAINDYRFMQLYDWSLRTNHSAPTGSSASYLAKYTRQAESWHRTDYQAWYATTGVQQKQAYDTAVAKAAARDAAWFKAQRTDDVNEAIGWVLGKADEGLVWANDRMEDLRTRSRSGLDGSTNFIEASFAAVGYAINEGSTAFGQGVISGFRVITNVEARQNAAMGIYNLATNTSQTLSDGWTAWSNLPQGERSRQGIAMLVGLGAAASKLPGGSGAVVDVTPTGVPLSNQVKTWDDLGVPKLSPYGTSVADEIGSLKQVARNNNGGKLNIPGPGERALTKGQYKAFISETRSKGDVLQDRLDARISSQDYVYRATTLRAVENYRSLEFVRGYMSTDYVGLDPQVLMNRGQVFSHWGEPEVLLRIPSSELVNAKVPRPMGNTLSVGWEPDTSFYPAAGSGNMNQFLGTTRSWDDSWVIPLIKRSNP